MSKTKLGITAIAAATLLTGCDTAVHIASDNYGVIVDASGRTDYEEVYSNETLLLSGWCWNKCDKTHVFERVLYPTEYKGKYIMPKNNDLELELDVELIVSFDDSRANRAASLQSVAENYPVRGNSSIRHSMVEDVVAVELSAAKVKDTLRPLLAAHKIETVMTDVTSENKIKKQVFNALAAKLEKTPLVLHDVNFVRIGWPTSITNKKKEISEMDSEREIERKRLQNDRAKEAERQAFRIEQALNDVEIDSIYQKVMSPDMINWLWVDTANRFAEEGIPFAFDASMLAVATNGKSKQESMDIEGFREQFEERLAELAKDSETSTKD